MNINKTVTEEKTILALSGEMDTITASKLETALIPEFDQTKHVELDFARLTFVSSAGLRVLLTCEKAAKAKGCRQVIVNVPESIVEVFDITGFSGILDIEK